MIVQYGKTRCSYKAISVDISRNTAIDRNDVHWLLFSQCIIIVICYSADYNTKLILLVETNFTVD